MLRRRRRPSLIHDDNPECGKWVKAGLEFTGGTLHASSVVATSPSGADWSLSPLFPPGNFHESLSSDASSLRIKFERIGEALWIWYRNPAASSFWVPRSPEIASAGWTKMREVMGFFSGVESKGGVWLGCYASRPMDFMTSSSWEGADDGLGRGLTVEFEELEIL